MIFLKPPKHLRLNKILRKFTRCWRQSFIYKILIISFSFDNIMVFPWFFQTNCRLWVWVNRSSDRRLVKLKSINHWPNAAMLLMNVIVMLRLRSPCNRTVQMLDPPPPGEQPVTKRPNPNSGLICETMAIPNATFNRINNAVNKGKG